MYSCASRYIYRGKQAHSMSPATPVGTTKAGPSHTRQKSDCLSRSQLSIRRTRSRLGVGLGVNRNKEGEIHLYNSTATHTPCPGPRRGESALRPVAHPTQDRSEEHTSALQ